MTSALQPFHLLVIASAGPGGFAVPEKSVRNIGEGLLAVEFGPDGAKGKRYRVRDTSRDGLGDLLLRFRIRKTGIACGDS